MDCSERLLMLGLLSFTFNLTPAARSAVAAPGCSAMRYCDTIQATSVLISASGTLPLFGGIGMAPQVPDPPSDTFFSSIAAASALPLYFLATSRSEEHTSELQ